MKKVIDKLDKAFGITTLWTLEGLVWGIWVAGIYFVPSTLLKWCFGLLPPVTLVAVFIVLWRGDKNEN